MTYAPILIHARRIVATVAKCMDHDEHDVEAILNGSIDSRLAVRAVVLALRPPSVRNVLCDQALGDALAAAARQSGDVKQAPAESPQSGPKGNAQTPPPKSVAG